jgi:hypothetical protein
LASTSPSRQSIWTTATSTFTPPLSPGQAGEIDRVCATFPEFIDDDFVAAHLDDWLA